METPEVDRVLESASAQFEAALAAQEDTAANDLALSLLQDSALSVLLTRSAWLVQRPGGGAAVLTHIGPDVVIASSGAGNSEDLIVPLATARFVAGEGGPPEQISDRFIALLRREVRRRSTAGVWIGGEPLEGRLKLVTESHLVLGRPAGEAVLPLRHVREVQIRG